MAEFIVPSLAVAAVAAVTMAWTNQSIPNISDAWTFLFPKEIWDPLLQWLWPGFSFVWIMAWILGITYAILFYAEKTYPIPGAWNPWVIFWIVVTLFVLFLVIAWYISPIKIFGVEIMSTTPNTCTGQKTSLEAGLCYNNCDPGYHGSMTSCYADSVNNGAGTVVGLEPCRDGYRTEGLVCSNIHWNGCKYNTVIGCIGGLEGDMYGRLDHGGVCPGPQDFGGDFDTEYKNWQRAADKGEPTIDPATGQTETDVQAAAANHRTAADIAYIGTDKHSEKIDGMCYKKCPAEYPTHIPGMPYLCYKGGALFYDRGVGDPPRLFRLFGKYAFPPFG
jgi:hypothetical protein